MSRPPSGSWASALVVEIAVYGGVALMLTFPGRPATKRTSMPARARRERSPDARATWRRTEDWLNDAVKGFLSAHPVTRRHRPFHSGGGSKNTILTAKTRFGVEELMGRLAERKHA
jgi:hypothetical protein